MKTQADSGMQRNGLSYKSTEMEPDKWSRISSFVHTVDNVRGPVGYVWSVSVDRYARAGPIRFQPEFDVLQCSIREIGARRVLGQSD